MDDLPQRVADLPVTEVSGTWLRWCPGRYAQTALKGRAGDGRWGTAGGFKVLYLGDTVDTIVAEAYRHLVDKYEDPDQRAQIAAGIHGLVMVRASVRVRDVLDLRSPGARLQSGLGLDTLECPPWDHAGYAACQQVAQVAHQLGRHGVLAPAATRLGLTLALFPERLPRDERPTREGADEPWRGLPADPRQLSTPHLRLIDPAGPRTSD